MTNGESGVIRPGEATAGVRPRSVTAWVRRFWSENSRSSVFVYISLAMAGLIWLIDSGIHKLVFSRSNITTSLFPDNPVELWDRIFMVVVVLIGGFFASAASKRLSRLEARNRQLRGDLESALAKLPSGFLPICSYCKRIRDKQQNWEQVERYMAKRTDLQFSHGICPTCMEEHFPEFSDTKS